MLRKKLIYESLSAVDVKKSVYKIIVSLRLNYSKNSEQNTHLT